MLKSLMFSLSVAAMPVAAFAQASAPETLKRSGKWVLDYDRDACHLIAQFGTGKDVMLMRLTRYELGDTFHFDIYSRKLAISAVTSNATLDFGLRGTPIDAQAVSAKAGDLPMLLFGSMRLDGWQREGRDEIAPKLSVAQEASVSGVTVRIGRKKPFRLEFGSLARPMAQLRACQADLLKSWGYDPAVQTTLSAPARPTNSPATWLSDSDYPIGAIAMGQNGIVQFRLDVAADGRVAGCHVLARTSPDVFADTTCSVVSRRAKLEPARDAAGQPVRSFYVQKVQWRMAE